MSDEILVGRNPVFEVLKSERGVNKVLISEQINQQTERELQKLVKKKNTILQKVPKQRLDQLTKERHQGMLAYVAPYERSEEHTSELQSRFDIVCRLLLEK